MDRRMIASPDSIYAAWTIRLFPSLGFFNTDGVPFQIENVTPLGNDIQRWLRTHVVAFFLGNVLH